MGPRSTTTGAGSRTHLVWSDGMVTYRSRARSGGTRRSTWPNRCASREPTCPARCRRVMRLRTGPPHALRPSLSPSSPVRARRLPQVDGRDSPDRGLRGAGCVRGSAGDHGSAWPVLARRRGRCQGRVAGRRPVENEDTLRVMLASSGEEDSRLALGVPDATWGHLVTVTSVGRTVSSRTSSSSPGSADPRRLTDRSVAPADRRPRSDARGRVRRWIDHRARRGSARKGQRRPARPASRSSNISFVPRHGSSNCRSLRLRHALAGRFHPLRRRARAWAAGRPLPGARDRYRDRPHARRVIVDKRNVDEAMAGWAIDQALRPDGMVLTLYRGVSTRSSTPSKCRSLGVSIDLPERGMDDAAATADWGVVADCRRTVEPGHQRHAGHDRRRLPRANSPFVAWSTSSLLQNAASPLRSSGTRRPVSGSAVVTAPDGTAVFAAGSGGRRSHRDGRPDCHSRALEGIAVDAIAVTPDSSTLYALVRDGGRVARTRRGHRRAAGLGRR